jgi:hypothetical protein
MAQINNKELVLKFQILIAAILLFTNRKLLLLYDV